MHRRRHGPWFCVQSCHNLESSIHSHSWHAAGSRPQRSRQQVGAFGAGPSDSKAQPWLLHLVPHFRRRQSLRQEAAPLFSLAFPDSSRETMSRGLARPCPEEARLPVRARPPGAYSAGNGSSEEQMCNPRTWGGHAEGVQQSRQRRGQRRLCPLSQRWTRPGEWLNLQRKRK